MRSIKKAVASLLALAMLFTMVFGVTVFAEEEKKAEDAAAVEKAGNYYATLGRWSNEAGEFGTTIMKYDADKGTFEEIDTVDLNVISGSQGLNSVKNVVYVCDEKETRDEGIGGGGYVMAYSVDGKTGEMTLLNKVESLGVAPSYATVDSTGKYLLVVNHGKENHVTQTTRNKNGELEVKVLLDESSLVVFELEEDGSIGKATDLYAIYGDGPMAKSHAFSHLHSVTMSPDGQLFFVCDKGTDKVHTFKLNEERGTLIKLDEKDVDAKTVPRYSVFHPTLPIVYQNLENCTKVNAWKYDEKGKLELTQTIDLFTADEIKELASKDIAIDENGALKFGPSDIILNKDGSKMYVSVRKANKIVVVDIDKEGTMEVAQVVDCGGDNARGLCLAPDGKFLFCVNMASADIARFIVESDGTLTFDETVAKDLNAPANLVIAEY